MVRVNPEAGEAAALLSRGDGAELVSATGRAVPPTASQPEAEEVRRLREEKVTALLKQLRLDEKVWLLTGVGMWEAGGVPRLGLPPMRFTDGPSGARGLGLHGEDGVALAPCHTSLAATFDEALIEEIGGLLGEECARVGAHVLLAPNLNIQRLPVTGRHFECFSEDPYLTSRAAVAYVRGVQRHVAACAKHFVGNDQEADRAHMNSVIDPRVLHEVYLAPFEAAVREAGVEAIMPGYNRVNGLYCAEHGHLLQQVLRESWGFQGLLVSDWWANRSTVAAVKAGLNVEMPGIEPRYYGGYLLDAARAGEVSEELLDERCRPVLRTLLRRSPPPGAGPGRVGGAANTATARIAAGRRHQLLRRAASASLVLLKNEGAVLPLNLAELGVRSVAVIGPNAAATTVQGGGSSRVHPKRCRTILESLTAALSQRGVAVRHEPGCTPGRRETRSAELEGLERMGACDASGQPIDNYRLVKVLDFLLNFVSYLSRKEWFRRGCMPLLRLFGLRHTAHSEPRNLVNADFGGGGRRQWLRWAAGGAAVGALAALGIGGAAPLMMLQGTAVGAALGVVATESMSMRSEANDGHLLEAAEKAAKEADACILVLGTDGFWELEGVDQPHMMLPGRQDELARRCIAAARGKPLAIVLNVGSPKELPWLSEAQSVLLAYFSGEGTADAVADALLGEVTPSGRLPTTWPLRFEQAPAAAAAAAAVAAGGTPTAGGDVVYSEGLGVGYRGLKDAPLFPFGHGLSYTTFAYERFEANLLARPGSDGGARAEVRLCVRNTGHRAASEVVQVYTETENAPRALRGFVRTRVLDPLSEEQLVLELSDRDLGAFYDARKGAWSPPRPGSSVRVEVGASSSDIRASAVIPL